MNTVFSEELILKLATALRKSYLHAHAAKTVTERFRSMHYLSSTLICDCIVLNLAMNDNVTPVSANEIITCVRRKNKSLYTTVDSAYFPIKDNFEEYAKTVLGEEYNNIKKLDMRNTNYLVYVMSVDIKNRIDIDRTKVFYGALSYDELLKYGLPRYD